VRQISAIFDSRMLGYQGSLVAMKVDPAREDEAAAIINAHPGVSHNYKRSHQYNIWFTLTLPPGMDLKEEIDRLAEKAGAEKTWPLPTIHLYKIGVTMDMTGDKDRKEREEPGARARNRTRDLSLSTADVSLIRELQRDLPIIAEPFVEWARNLEISVETLLAEAQRFIEEGKMRRFAAVLHHREAGFSYNAMAVWECPTERIAECGRIMASFKAVSHCYERPTYDDWPYPLFTMIHGQNEQDCLTVVDEIARATALDRHALLYSTKEYKKVRVQYFTEDYAQYLDAEGRVRRPGDAAPVLAG
jgi:DNA-binding Lrp family transcriptional regulator